MNFLSRVNRLHIVGAGGVIFVALLVAFSLAFLQPQLQHIKDVRAKQEQAEATWRQLPEKVAALSQAQQSRDTAQSAAEELLASMPKLSTEPFQAMFDLHREYSTGTGPALLQFFASRGYQPRGIVVPASPLQPTLLPPLLTLPMGGFGIQAKSLPAALNFLRQLKDMPRIGVIGGITIQGTSPNLNVTMPLTVYIMTQQALARPSPAAIAAMRGPAGAAKAGGARAPGAPGGTKIRLRMGGGGRD